MSDEAQEWRWVGEDGVQKTVAEPELIAGLSGETVPNYTLVWRSGWLEWLPAMQVEELAWALPPGKSDEPTRPREGAPSASPPAPPLYRYSVLKRRASALRTDRTAPKPAVVPRPAAKKASEPAPVSTVPSDPKTEPVRPPIEEVEMAQVLASSPTSAPGTDGPVPVDTAPATASRGETVTGEVLEPDDDDAPIIEPDLDSAPALGSSPGVRAYGQEDDAETRVLHSRPPGPMYVAPHTPPASEHAPPNSEDGRGALPNIPPPPKAPGDLGEYGAAPKGASRRPSLLVLFSVLLVALILAVVVVLLGRTDDGAGEVTAGAAPPSSSPAPSAAGPSNGTGVLARSDTRASARRPTGRPCSILTPALRVAEWADPSVLQSFAAIPGSSRIAIGFGQTESYAIGITIEPRTLDRDQVFRESRPARLVSVVPTAGNGKLQFHVARKDDTLSNARTVDAETPFVVGGSERTLSRQVGKRPPEPLWDLDDASAITVPRVTSVKGIGHAVTFRRGGRSGKVALGWLDPDGRKRSPLTDVGMPGDFAGTPAIAAGDAGILVAFAVRSEGDEGWSLALASAEAGAAPRSASRFALPPGGPGGDVISPSVAALSDGRWLLQWTEGKTGQRVVRAQVLDRNLEPSTEPISLSPEGSNAGQGAAWASGSVASVLFYVQNEKKSHELWGSSIECPR